MTESNLKASYLFVPGSPAAIEFTGLEPDEVLATIRAFVSARPGSTVRQVHDKRGAVLVDFAAIPLAVTADPPPPGYLVVSAAVGTLSY